MIDFPNFSTAQTLNGTRYLKLNSLTHYFIYFIGDIYYIALKGLIVRLPQIFTRMESKTYICKDMDYNKILLKFC